MHNVNNKQIKLRLYIYIIILVCLGRRNRRNICGYYVIPTRYIENSIAECARIFECWRFHRSLQRDLSSYNWFSTNRYNARLKLCIYILILHITLSLSHILAALFFLTYEEIKTIMQPKVSTKYYTVLHMGAATLGEMVLF